MRTRLVCVICVALAACAAPTSAGDAAASDAASRDGAPDTARERDAPADAFVPPAPTIGTGDIDHPAVGPMPTEATTLGGAPWVLVKNWDFGTAGTITHRTDLVAEFQFHDQFGTIANGTNYGAVIVAPTDAEAIGVSGDLHLPGNRQPVEDPSRPTWEWSADVMMAHVRPLDASTGSVSVSAHDVGCGSFVARWELPNGGSRLGRELLWETRARIATPQPAYWFAIWTAGNAWNHGAEMDVLESFGTPNVSPIATAFHVNAVPSTHDAIDYAGWPSGLDMAGVPTGAARDLRELHTWSWLYRTDDTYVVYYDGHEVQRGALPWTLAAAPTGDALDMTFLFDLGWGHTQIADENITLPASSFPITYEVDYSRVYLR